MLVWQVLLAIIIAKIAGKKIREWLESAEVKKEFEELVMVINKAYKDGKITIDEIPGILKEACDLVKVIINKKEGGEK